MDSIWAYVPGQSLSPFVSISSSWSPLSLNEVSARHIFSPLSIDQKKKRFQSSNSLIACSTVLSSLQQLPTERDEVNLKPRASFGHILPSIYALLNSDDEEPVAMKVDNVAPVEDNASDDAPVEDTTSDDAPVAGGSPSDRCTSSAAKLMSSCVPAEAAAPVVGEVQPVQDGATADSIVQMVAKREWFDDIIEKVMTARSTSHTNAVCIMVDALSDDAVHGILMHFGTSLLSMCQIADANARGKRLGTRAVHKRYANSIDFSAQLNKWTDEQIARFFELFGVSIVRLDIAKVNRPELVLEHIVAKCATSTGTDIDQVRAFFTYLISLDITDITEGLDIFRFFNDRPTLMCVTTHNRYRQVTCVERSRAAFGEAILGAVQRIRPTMHI